MNARERTLTALRRQPTDRPPMHMSLCRSQMDTLLEKTGKSDPYEVFPLDVKYVGGAGLEENPALRESRFFQAVSGAQEVNEWGVGFNAGAYHFQSMVHPLAGFSDERDAREYPFPLLKSGGGLKASVERVKAQGYAAAANVAPMGGTVFWPAYKLRGMEQLFIDMVEAPEYAQALFERVTALSEGMAREAARAGADILWMADDFGTQRELMMSPRMWRSWFKDPLKRVVDAARAESPDILIALHSDGKIDAIIPDLIEIGVQVLNPVQPECMDPKEIKREFGAHLAFWGTVGTQTTMPFGSPEDVRRVVREMIATVGCGGGLLIAPTHVVEPETPWENILAFVDEVLRAVV